MSSAQLVKMEDEEVEESQEISSMVNFLLANKNKIMQICMAADDQLDFEKFDEIYQNLLQKNIASALDASMRITILILDILDTNNITS